jgi:hypothetical protein
MAISPDDLGSRVRVDMSNAPIPKGGSLLDRFGTKIYRWWFGFRDHTGAFRQSDFAEGVAASLFQSHRIYLRTIWQEFCNVYRRIALLHTYKLHRCGIPLLTASEQASTPRHQKYIYRRARTKNIRTLLAIHPGATLIDLFLLTRLHCPFGEDCRMAKETIPSRLDDESAHSCRMQKGQDTKNSRP